MGKKIWDYEDHDGSFEDCIDNLLERKKNYCFNNNFKICF